MKAVILAAGPGLRLWPLTKETNKVILPLDKTSTLENMLSLICNEGIEPVVVTGFDHQKVSEVVQRYNGSFIYNKYFEKYPYGYSLTLAWKVFRDYETLLLNGDIFIDRKTLQTVLFTQGNSTSVYNNVKHETDWVLIGKNNIVKELQENTEKDSNLKNIVGHTTSIYHFKEGSQMHSILKESQNSKDYSKIKMVNKLIQVEGMKYVINKGLYLNLNTFEDLTNLKNYILNKNNKELRRT